MSIVIEMVSDLACPWCWLGLRRIRAALEQTSDIETALYFRPFELDPTIPAEGVDYRTYMAARTEGLDPETATAQKERFATMREALETYGEAESVPFRFEDMPVRPNTFNAHRLVYWAQGQGKGAKAKEALFAAYFSDHRHIGETDVLAGIAGEIGLDGAIVRDLLARDADREAVRTEQRFFREMGVNGVPTFIGDRRLAVQGAESADKLVRFIRTLAERQPTERGLAST